MEIKKYIKTRLEKQGFEDIIITKNILEAKQIKFSKNKIVKTGTELAEDLSFFLTKNKRILVTDLKELSKQNIDKFAKKSAKFIKNLPKNENYYGIAKGPFKYKNIKEFYDKKVLDINDIDLLEKGLNASFNQGIKRADGILEITKTKTELLTSNNAEAEQHSSSLYFSIRSFANKDASGHSNVVSRTLKKFDVEYAGKHSGEIAKKALNPQEGKEGKYDVIFDPLPLSGLIGDIGNACSIFSVEAGLSFLANKLKKQIASKTFTLIDDPLYQNGIGATKFDLEGTPTQKNILIKNGILQKYLHNTSTAKRYNTKTTANAGLIAPQPWNLVVKPGKTKQESLFKGIKKGIYITNLWYTRFTNYFTGDFSTIPRDGTFYIENGEIKYPIKNIRVSDNMLNLMKNIKEVANNVIQTKSWEAQEPAIIPSILVTNINITKPTQ